MILLIFKFLMCVLLFVDRRHKNQLKASKHLLLFNAMFYRHISDSKLGNRSQAQLHDARKFKIFEYSNMLIPVYNGVDWHFATCIVCNHNTLAASRGSAKELDDDSPLPCILYLDPADVGLLKHDTILKWLNEEFKLNHQSSLSPFTPESMPMYQLPRKCWLNKNQNAHLLLLTMHFPVQNQEEGWECGYLLCTFIGMAHRKLKLDLVTKKDRDDRFRKFADSFRFQMADVDAVKNAIEQLAVTASKLALGNKNVTTKPAKRKESVLDYFCGYGAPTPARLRKVKDLVENGPAKKRKTRKVGSRPESLAQCKDKYVREHLASVTTAFESKVWPMSTMPNYSGGDSGTLFFVGCVDFTRGNNERQPFEDAGAVRKVPRLTLLHPSAGARQKILESFKLTSENAEHIDLVEASTGKEFLGAIHGCSQKIPRCFQQIQHHDSQGRTKVAAGLDGGNNGSIEEEDHVKENVTKKLTFAEGYY